MSRTFKYISLSLLFAATILLASGQEASYETDPKAKKAFDNGLIYWRVSDFEKAEKELRKAIEIDPQYPEPYILLGDLLYDQGDLTLAAEQYKRAIDVDSLHSARLYYLLGRVYFDQKSFTDAVYWLNRYTDSDDAREDLTDYAEDMIEKARFRQYALANPVPFEPENLGAHINSEHHEYVNSITLDEKRMVYTLTKPDSVIRGHFTEGFELALNTDSGWVVSGRTLPDLHELGNIGAMSLTADGRFLFFTSCGAVAGYGSCDLYVCGREGEGWTRPQNLGMVVNTPTWDTQPCFSADGKTLYYVSARTGGMGGSDIWQTTFIQDKGWTVPKNLGSAINTSDDEMAPFIHPDGKTMYFSSKGHTGMGGFDLFISRIDSNGNWTEPENLGWPVNTEYDEINIVVATNGKAAYISSRQEEGFGGYDIYRFGLPEKLAPERVSYLEGHVYDAETRKPIGAEILLIDLVSGENTVRCESDTENGHYIAALPGGRNYALNISKPGYLFYSENFDLIATDTPEESVKKDVYLQPIKAGVSFVLNNIFFETDQYNLDELSLVELNKLYTFLTNNPDLRILICGHTDDVGTEEYNQTLSENRAGAVYGYLVDEGIHPERLEFKGFGKSQPVSDNETEAGRALNRRTEIVIL